MKKMLKLSILLLIVMILAQNPLAALADGTAPSTALTDTVGFITDKDGSIYYIDTKGILVTGPFTVDGKTYRANAETGILCKGWYENNGKKYYYSLTDGHLFTGWHTIGDYRYYFDPADGCMFKEWHTIGDYRYYFNKSNGQMFKGWHTIGDYQYYFNKSNGRMFKGWHTIGDYQYYFNKSNGRMFKGWHTIGDYKYFFNKRNGRMFKGMHTIGDYQYYFNKSNGRMFKGLHKIGKNVYTFSKTGKLVRTVYAKKKSVCLTYDDGPSANTQTILKTLKKNGALATFFVVGERVGWYPDAIKSMAAMRCQIANHSYTHPYYWNLSVAQIKNQIKNCNASVRKYAGVGPTVCRTPGGGQSTAINSAVGMPIILWSVDTLDWKIRDAGSVYSKAMSNVNDGAIILMHDLYSSTASAATRIIPALKNRGYQMVTIREMALLKGVTLVKGKIYSHF